MGIKRYLKCSNWYSDDVVLLLRREPAVFEMKSLSMNHKVAVVDNNNYGDSQVFENKEYLEIYQKFLEHGDIGVYAYVDGKCAARCWGVICPDSVSEGGACLGLESDSVFVHYVRTDRRHRREGLGRECLGKLVELCMDKVMYVTINIDNTPSINLHKDFGFREIGIIRVRRRFMRQYAKIYRMDRIQV